MNLRTRLERLEAEATANHGRPVILWVDEPEPEGIGAKPIVRVRWMTEAEAAASDLT
jgi:hypothetical protein